MTYTEWKLQKTAVEKSVYQQTQDRINAGDEAAINAMATPTSQEVLWHLLGAGLGAGGGYLLSRKLRRNDNKRQRALDMIVGALIGAFGTNVALNAIPGDKATGFSMKDVIRADELATAEGTKKAEGNDTVKKEKPSKYAPNATNVTMAAAMTPIGMYTGHELGIAEGVLRNIATNKAIRKAEGQALLRGERGTPEFTNYMRQKAVQNNITAAGERAARLGGAADTLTGGALFGAGGYYLGSQIPYWIHGEENF